MNASSKVLLYLSFTLLLLSCSSKHQEPSLKDALGDKFLIGVAVNELQANGIDSIGSALICRHFNSIANENCIKSERIHPEENRYEFANSDAFVDFGTKNGMNIIGHTLIWHSQMAPWFCSDENGNNVTPEVMKQRMKDHIHTIIGRYKGRINGWDLVNEALLDDGKWRESKFYEILGEEYIALAFQYAHEADPDAELYYNDYNLYKPEKCKGAVKIIKMLKERGLRIDAVGMQGHMGMEYPSVNEFEESIIALSQAGVKVMITEWDMSALPSPFQSANISDTTNYIDSMNPYPDSLPDDVSKVWNQRMESFWKLFIKHSDKISRVTMWGLSDSDSWKNDWPIVGRTDYTLLFDRMHQPKPVTEWLINR